MSKIVRPIGWFMRNLPKTSNARHFWREQIGLPLIRPVGEVMDILWGGETIAIELAFSLPDDAPAGLPAGYLPIFRAHGLGDIVARLRAAGLEPASDSTGPSGREVIYRDEQGHGVGLRERSAAAALPQDVEARRRERRGEAFNPGCKPMPDGIQELGWIQRQVADVAAMAKFYRDVLESETVGREGEALLLDIGDNVLLELIPGGQPVTPPADRKSADALIILRVDAIDEFRKRLAAKGVNVINDKIETYWGELTYFTDPEGHVIGVECARHPGTYSPPKMALSEGLEADRRWKEACAPEA